MADQLTKDEARAFKARWEEVNAAECRELRRMSPTHKFRQLTSLMRWVNELGWSGILAEEEREVRERWNRLRRVYRV